MTLRKIEPPIEERISTWKELIQAALKSHEEGSSSPVGAINLEGVTPEDWALMEAADQALVALIEEYEKLQAQLTCPHKRTMKIGAWCRDLCNVRWPNGQESNGYPPSIPGFSGGDDVTVMFCVDCHKILNLPSIEEVLKEQPEEETEED